MVLELIFLIWQTELGWWSVDQFLIALFFIQTK